MFYFRERLEPYNTSADDWRIPGSLKLLEIPNFADLSQTHNDHLASSPGQLPCKGSSLW